MFDDTVHITNVCINIIIMIAITLGQCHISDFVARLRCATLTGVKVAQNRAALYSENESRDCATRHDATCDTPCHTLDVNARPLSRIKVARLCRRCDVGLTRC